MFREFASRKELHTKVFYGWEGTSNVSDPGFGQTVTWDIPLLEGYDYEFVANTAPKPSSAHFKGIVLPSLNQQIVDWQADAILIFGWSYHAHLSAMRFFKGKIPVLFRGDSTLLNERSGPRRWARRLFLKWIYRHIDIALAVGSNNRLYFEKHGVPADRIRFAPHAIDNCRFGSDGDVRQAAADRWRLELGIGQDSKVVLFVGKLERVKAPDLLLAAFRQLNHPDLHLVFVGSGPLESLLRGRANDRVHFMGFQNQSRLPEAYRLADVVVLCSGSETWGLALNEAMACGRALIVSDRVGAGVDLIDPGKNGWCFPYDQPAALRQLLRTVAECSRRELQEMGKLSLSKIQHWSIAAQVDATVSAVQSALASPAKSG